MSSPWSQEGTDPGQPGLSGGGYQPDSSYQPGPLVGRPDESGAVPPQPAPASSAAPGPSYLSYQSAYAPADEQPTRAPQPSFQPYPGPSSYPQQSLAPYHAAYAEHPNATTILVLGVLGLVLCQFLGPVAWIMGHSARAQTRQGMYFPSGKVTAGWILGIVATLGPALYILLMVLTALLNGL